MIPSNLHFIKNSVLGTLISGLTLWGGNASAAVVTASYPETAPTSDIVSSYVVPSTGDYGVYNFSASSYREVSSSFITPSSSDYLVNAFTLQIGSVLTTSFTAPANFSIEVWSLAAPGNGPLSGGSSLVNTYTGVMQPTSSQTQVGDYLTFSFDTPFLATAGKAYSFIMSLDSSAAGNILRWSIGAADPAGTRALSSTNGAAWANTGLTYIYYVEGTAVPEPMSMALLGLAAVAILIMRKSRVKAHGEA